jgi:ABC-type multidrug transport system ATPase subunit
MFIVIILVERIHRLAAPSLQARVVFTAIKLSEPHILLLDEPTNNLDMQSIDALSDAIEDFEGGVIVISHDGQLLSRMCEDEERSEVWIVDGGEITFHKGGFEVLLYYKIFSQMCAVSDCLSVIFQLFFLVLPFLELA